MTVKESSEKTLKVSESSASISVPLSKTQAEKNDDDFEQRLVHLPEQYRDEILRQYDLPASKVSLLSMLGFATWVEVILMIVGSLLSIVAGTQPTLLKTNE